MNLGEPVYYLTPQSLDEQGEKLPAFRLRSVFMGTSDNTSNPKIPEHYKDFADMFSETNAGVIPENTQHDRPIDIQLGMQPPNI